MKAAPKTRYAKTRDGLSIAYQAVGDGPVDLAKVGGTFGNVESGWEVPQVAHHLESLASFSRLILHDLRGTGLSDHPQGVLTLESQVEDALAVLDAAGSRRAFVMGSMQSGAPAALFAAQYPERTAGFIWYLPTPRASWAPDYPWGMTPERRALEDAVAEVDWGGEAPVRAYFERDNPSLANDPELTAEIAWAMRQGASPRVALEMSRVWWGIDVRHVLPSIRVPTLVIDRDGGIPEEGEYTASLIPDCKRVVLKGRDCLEFLGDSESVVDAIRDFLGIPRQLPELDRMLATVLFTDIVGSTGKACEVGDACWKELLERHRQVTRAMLARYRGTEVNTTGDGFLATFDGPARAVTCAQAICEAVKPLGLEVRAGCHTGEIELMGADVGGVAVHIGARVAALAGPSEVLVSSTVKDLVAGSGLAFEDRGEHQLKGVPDDWHMWALASAV